MKVTVLGAALVVVAVFAAILLLRQFARRHNQANPPKG
jgi:hypothetical protein